MKRYIACARKPRWWDSQFRNHVCEAYDAGILSLDPNDILTWWQEYNNSPTISDSDFKSIVDIIKYYDYLKSKGKAVKASTYYETMNKQQLIEEIVLNVSSAIDYGDIADEYEIRHEVYAQVAKVAGHLDIDDMDEIEDAVLDQLELEGYIN